MFSLAIVNLIKQTWLGFFMSSLRMMLLFFDEEYKFSKEKIIIYECYIAVDESAYCRWLSRMRAFPFAVLKYMRQQSPE